jgi:hypothetical protein
MFNNLEETFFSPTYYTAFEFKKSRELEQWEKGLLSEVKCLGG